MKSRMKTFRVSVPCGHESFNDYDSKDSDQVYEVKALNEKFAISKACAIFDKKFRDTKLYRRNEVQATRLDKAAKKEKGA